MNVYEKLIVALIIACLFLLTFDRGIEVGESRVYDVAMKEGDIKYQLESDNSPYSCVVVVNRNPYLIIIQNKDYFCEED